MQTCRKCGVEKSLDSFKSQPRRKNGVSTQCKPCINAKRNDTRKQRRKEEGRAEYDHYDFRGRHPQRYNPAVRRKARLRGRYGLSETQVAEMQMQQEGRCAICREERPLCIDHDHATGAVRGLLCRSCNVGIGHLRDSVPFLLSAVAYLQA